MEVALAASSLNFRDVMMVMGIYPGEETAVGSDGAGIVTAVGDGVSGIQVGDRVAVSAYGCLRTHITLPAAMTCPLPADISFEQAAALPVAYITACYGLEELAGIRAGQTVLIHAASGGVGLATMAVCRRAGARIFATAGTPAKRELVRSLGAELVMDSRSTAFAQEVLDATGGRGWTSSSTPWPARRRKPPSRWWRTMAASWSWARAVCARRATTGPNAASCATVLWIWWSWDATGPT
ncbi:zinc-binding dehydrogenase [Desulfovibrio piger]|uniref:Zinc-binding dehydrogenase n=1 Tax=Desulfovibrio piger TaxID=901 RepID=A0A848C789_9BACT|nr:zinc-binding dehydrogenase [Desulfovibrio piger]